MSVTDDEMSEAVVFALLEGDIRQCEECKEWSLISLWAESETDCDQCGSHSASRCPLCAYDHDHVWVKVNERIGGVYLDWQDL